MRRPILDIQHLKKYFPVTSGVFMRRTGNVHAVDDISFSVFKGETLGIVGESGCGKSTLGRCIMGLYPLTQGRILLDGKPLSAMTRKMRKIFSTRAQMIFQDPFESLNPRQTVRQILEEKFRIHGVSQQETAMQIELLLDQVGLDPGALTKYPHEFSGGQRQRIGVARAISMTPQIVICDEPVSALDVSVQSKIPMICPWSATCLTALLSCTWAVSWKLRMPKTYIIIRPIRIQRHCWRRCP